MRPCVVNRGRDCRVERPQGHLQNLGRQLPTVAVAQELLRDERLRGVNRELLPRITADSHKIVLNREMPVLDGEGRERTSLLLERERERLGKKAFRNPPANDQL